MADEIPLRPLGATGAMVSAIGLGGYHIGGMKSEREAIRLVHEAVHLGDQASGPARLCVLDLAPDAGDERLAHLGGGENQVLEPLRLGVTGQEIEQGGEVLAERLPAEAGGDSLETALGRLSLGELYLACACAEGLPEAISALEREYLSRLPRQLAHLRAPADVIDDVRQRVRELFLLPPGGGGRKL